MHFGSALRVAVRARGDDEASSLKTRWADEKNGSLNAWALGATKGESNRFGHSGDWKRSGTATNSNSWPVRSRRQKISVLESMYLPKMEVVASNFPVPTRHWPMMVAVPKTPTPLSSFVFFRQPFLLCNAGKCGLKWQEQQAAANRQTLP